VCRKGGGGGTGDNSTIGGHLEDDSYIKSGGKEVIRATGPKECDSKTLCGKALHSKDGEYNGRSTQDVW